MNKIFKNFMFRVGAEVVNKSKKIAPFKTGNLKKDIQVFKADQISVTIGNSKLAPYAKFVHFGTKPHIIKAKKVKGLANKKAGLFFGKQVNHPGTKAQPY
uniref:HK97 gp10 family phage protein n=4 Tax=Campylobacter fetus TaxID=196 RepID=UPI00138DE305